MGEMYEDGKGQRWRLFVYSGRAPSLVGNGQGLIWHHGSIPDYYPHANNPASRNAYWDGPLAMTALCPCITGTLDEHSEECREHKVDKKYKQSRPNPPLPQLIPSIFELNILLRKVSLSIVYRRKGVTPSRLATCFYQSVSQSVGHGTVAPSIRLAYGNEYAGVLHCHIALIRVHRKFRYTKQSLSMSVATNICCTASNGVLYVHSPLLWIR
jgi:hypothetical protein